MSDVESPHRIGKYIRAFEAALNNNRAFLQEFEKVAEELDAYTQANYNLKEQLKHAIEHNKKLQETIEQINKERKDETKAFTDRSDDTQMVLVANEQKIREDKAKISKLAGVVRKLQNKIEAEKNTERIQADELKTKDALLGQAEADVASKDATNEAKIKRIEQEKELAIQAKLDFEAQMTQQSATIIELEKKVEFLKTQLDQKAIDLAKARKNNPNELHKVNIKY